MNNKKSLLIQPISTTNIAGFTTTFSILSKHLCHNYSPQLPTRLKVVSNEYIITNSQKPERKDAPTRLYQHRQETTLSEIAHRIAYRLRIQKSHVSGAESRFEIGNTRYTSPSLMRARERSSRVFIVLGLLLLNAGPVRVRHKRLG